jgi:hypothetical protein
MERGAYVRPSRPSAADNPGRHPPACCGLISTIRLLDQPRDRYPDDRSPSARPQRSSSGGRCARHPKLAKPINCAQQLPVRSGRSYGSTGSWHDHSTGKRCANRVALGGDCKAAGASKPRVCITRIQGLTPFRFVLVARNGKDTPMDWPGFIWGH